VNPLLERLQLAFDLYEAGEDLMRQNLRRRHPSESAEQIEGRLVAWLSSRPGAQHGDSPGTPR
jgi:hypothetical protein